MARRVTVATTYDPLRVLKLLQMRRVVNPAICCNHLRPIEGTETYHDNCHVVKVGCNHLRPIEGTETRDVPSAGRELIAALQPPTTH